MYITTASRHFKNLRLPLPQHLNCNKFPGYPKLWIKPPSSSPVPPTAASTQNVSSFHFISSCSPTFSTTMSPQLMTSHTDSDSDTFYSKFIWFLADFLPKLVSSLYIVFIFVCFSFFVPLGLFVSYAWWLRFRVERPGLKKIPLREILLFLSFETVLKTVLELGFYSAILGLCRHFLEETIF